MNDNKQKKLDEAAALLQKGSRLCAEGDLAQGLALMDRGSALLRELDPECYAALDARNAVYHEKLRQLHARMDSIPAGDTAQLAACLEEVQRLNDWYTEKIGADK